MTVDDRMLGLRRDNETLTYQLVEARLVVQVQAAYILDLERRMRGEPVSTLHVAPESTAASA
jgi:hypothetical protein